MTKSELRARIFMAALAVGFAACADPSADGIITPPANPPVEPRLTLEGISSDTTGMAHFLTATVTDSTGRARADIEVVFSAASPQANADSILVSALDHVDYGPSARVRTDSHGVARIGVLFGRRLARSPITVSVPDLSLTGETMYETRPGNLVSVIRMPADTTITVGSAYRLQAVGADRNGNVRSGDLVQFGPGNQPASNPPVGTVDQTGNVTASRPGLVRFNVLVLAVNPLAPAPCQQQPVPGCSSWWTTRGEVMTVRVVAPE